MTSKEFKCELEGKEPDEEQKQTCVDGVGEQGWPIQGEEEHPQQTLQTSPRSLPWQATVKQSKKLEKQWRRWVTESSLLYEGRRLILQRMKNCSLPQACRWIERWDWKAVYLWSGQKELSLIRLELWWKGWMKIQGVTCCAGSWQHAGPSGNAGLSYGGLLIVART